MTDTGQGVTIRADLHNHTHFSPDSILSPEYLLKRADERGIDQILREIRDGQAGGGADQTDREDEREPAPVRHQVGERASQFRVVFFTFS